jgi:hypothetical protein
LKIIAQYDVLVPHRVILNPVDDPASCQYDGLLYRCQVTAHLVYFQCVRGGSFIHENDYDLARRVNDDAFPRYDPLIRVQKGRILNNPTRKIQDCQSEIAAESYGDLVFIGTKSQSVYFR